MGVQGIPRARAALNGEMVTCKLNLVNGLIKMVTSGVKDLNLLYMPSTHQLRKQQAKLRIKGHDKTSSHYKIKQKNLLNEEDIDPDILKEVINTDPTHDQTAVNPTDNIEATLSNEDAESQAAALLLQLSTPTQDSPQTGDKDLGSSNTNHFTFENATDEIRRNLKLATVPQKRSRMYQLYANGNIVAEGHITHNSSTLHGRLINTDTHAIIDVQNVFDSSYIPAENNPFQEPLQEGQYLCWEKTNLLVVEKDTPHAKVQNVTRENSPFFCMS